MGSSATHHSIGDHTVTTCHSGESCAIWSSCDPWARGVPQALALLGALWIGSEPFFAGVTRGARFWSVTAVACGALLVLPLGVHALRDPSRGPMRARPPLDRRAPAGWLLAFACALATPVWLAGRPELRPDVLGCGFVLLPFYAIAITRALGWSRLLGRAIDADRVRRGARRFRVRAIDVDAATVSLAHGDGVEVVAGAPRELLAALVPGDEVLARLDRQGERLTPYRESPLRAVSLETLAAHRARMRDRDGVVLGLLRAVLWAAIPFAAIAARCLGDPIPGWRPF